MSQHRARGILRPHHARLWSVFDHAWDLYSRFPPEARKALTRYPIPRANNLWALLSYLAEEAFAEVEGVEALPGKNGFTLQFGADLLLRFHKMNADGGVSVSETGRSQDYYSEQPDFDGISSADLKLDCGYCLNDVETEISSVLVSQTVERQLVWSYSIPRPGAQGIMPIEVTPQKPATPARVLQLVRPRKDADGTTGEQ